MGKNKKPLYKNLKDTLDDVEITARQMNHWRSKGLFQPEFGQRTRQFTADDLAHLRFLKRLIVGLGLDVDTVKRLLQTVPSSYEAPAEFTFLNVATGKLVRPSTALRELFEVYGSEALATMEEWLLALTLRYFEVLHRDARKPRIYEVRREELLDQIKRMDLVARAEDPEDAYDEDEDGNVYATAPRFYPSLPGDPEPTPALLSELTNERDRRLRTMRQTGLRVERLRDEAVAAQ